MIKKLKPIARVITYDKNTNKVLLVRNRETSFWYAPGGTWEYEKENILECAEREVFEEAGLKVKIGKLIYVQEFHGSDKDGEVVCLEMFWLGELTHEQELNKDHMDLDTNGAVEEARWFSKEELQDLKVFPKRLKDSFWNNVDLSLNSEDLFIGVS